MSTNPGIHLNVYPYSQSRFQPAFLTYFRLSPKNLSVTALAAKHDAIFLIMYIISGDVVPVLVPKPVPAVQVSCAGVRAVPEVPAFAP